MVPRKCLREIVEFMAVPSVSSQYNRVENAGDDLAAMQVSPKAANLRLAEAWRTVSR
jgi:hypothetical protein